MSNVGFRIYSQVNRPDKNLIEGFRGIPVANIADCMSRLFCVDARIKPMNRVPVLGPAFTVKSRVSDNLLLNKAIDMAAPGDVIVVDVEGNLSHAVMGELMLLWAKQKGIAAFVVDGAVRDAQAISEMDDIGVFAAGATPKGPYKDGPGEINVPVSCGGVVIRPGDILAGDADGLVVIRPEDAEEVLVKAKATVEKEAGIMRDIANNAWDRAWIDKTLLTKSCEFMD